MERILIVDDEQAHLDILAEALSREYDVVTAPDGTDALRMMEGLDRLAGVLSDLDMMRMNGDELLQVVRITRPEVFRALMTAKIGTKQFEAVNLLGPDPHIIIPKPIASLRGLLNDLRGLPRP